MQPCRDHKGTVYGSSLAEIQFAISSSQSYTWGSVVSGGKMQYLVFPKDVRTDYEAVSNQNANIGI